MLPVGVGSNLIVRDGGIEGVVIRLGRGFNGIRVEDGRVIAGAAALDAHVARKAAEAGIDLTFLRTIPGSIGGAARMNAGCYGSYTADAFVGGAGGDAGAARRWSSAPADMGFAYRSTALPEGLVITEVTLAGPAGRAGGARARGWRRSSRGGTRASRPRSARRARPSATRRGSPRPGAPTTCTT